MKEKDKESPYVNIFLLSGGTRKKVLRLCLPSAYFFYRNISVHDTRCDKILHIEGFFSVLGISPPPLLRMGLRR